MWIHVLSLLCHLAALPSDPATPLPCWRSFGSTPT